MCVRDLMTTDVLIARLDDDRFAWIMHVDVEWSELGGLGAPHATFAAAL